MAVPQSSDWRKKAKERLKEKKDGDTFKLQEGVNCFRVLPNKKGTKYSPFLEIRMHRNVGAEKMSVRCGKDVEGKGKCWLCDSKIPALEGGSDAQKQRAATLNAVDQVITQVSRVDPDTGKFGAPKIQP